MMTTKIETINTLRLYGEAINETHWAVWRDMGTNPILMKTLGGIWDEPIALEKFTKNIMFWEEDEIGLWMFFSKENNQFIGRCGLRPIKLENRTETELSYAVVPQFWRQGFASEMAIEALNVGINHLNLRSIIAFTLPTNYPSIRTMQRLGFVYEKNIIHESLEHVLHRRKS